MKEIPEAEYRELRDCFTMLSQIGAYVEDFCDENDTTLMGVLRLLAEYHHMKSNDIYHHLDRLSSKQEKEQYSKQ